MAAKRTLIASVSAAALATCALALAAPASSAASISSASNASNTSSPELKITESWSGTLPQRVEPGQTVTLLTSFGQDTYNQPIQISGLSFALWASSTVAHDVQVQFMNPVTHAWVSMGPNNGQTWSYEFDTFLTEEPGKTYSSGVRFTISDKAPAGKWTVEYPTVWGVTTQDALPDGAISFPTGPTRTFTFKSSTAGTPTATHSSAPPQVRATHTAAKASPSPRRTATPATSAAPTPSATQTTAAAATMPETGAASPSTARIAAALDADVKSATASPALAAGAAAAVVVLLLGLGLWRRLRRRAA